MVESNGVASDSVHRARLGDVLAIMLLTLIGLGWACSPRPLEPAPRRKLTVFAASSLSDVFTDLKENFESSHRDTEVIFNFAGTQQLRMQVEQGASPDVLAAADEAHMQELVRRGFATSPRIFARGEPVLVVAKESAAAVTSLRDLPDAPRVVMGVPEVPIGRYTSRILANAAAAFGADYEPRVEARVVSREFNVRQVLAKVRLGEASAGFVYRTDVVAPDGDVVVVTIPPELNVLAAYPIAVLKKAAQPILARAWVRLLLSEEGRKRLSKFGFIPAGANAKSE